MKMRVAWVLVVLMALLGACNKNKAKKTQPGSEAAKEGAKVDDPTADKAADKVADDKGVTLLKVEGATDEKLDKTPTAAKERIAGPVAVVNGQDVASSLYYEEVDKIQKRSSKIPPERMNRIKENILKRIIEKELINQAVKGAGVKVDEAAIDLKFTEYKKRFRGEEQFANYLKHGRVTIESIRKRIRAKKELESLLEKRGALAVSDEEAQEFFKKNERFYQDREGVKARHILVKLSEKASKKDTAKAMAKIKDVEGALKKGMTFEEAAKKFSEGPSASRGGDLGFFGRGQMVKAFEEKAFVMKVNELSGPVRTRFGFHIIQVLEKREARKKDFSEVKDTIKDSLRNKKFFQERRTLLSGLKKDAKIERKIVIPKSSGKALSPHPGGVHGQAGQGHRGVKAAIGTGQPAKVVPAPPKPRSPAAPAPASK
jgi:peptidyl-prolyl cis-trans isomerase C